MSKKRWTYFLTLGIIAFLILSNPSEKRFLQKVSLEYGMMHGNTDMDVQMLRSIGTSRYTSYVFFSFYDYTYGSISVHYFGISFLTFYRGSKGFEQKEQEGQQDFLNI